MNHLIYLFNYAGGLQGAREGFNAAEQMSNELDASLRRLYCDLLGISTSLCSEAVLSARKRYLFLLYLFYSIYLILSFLAIFLFVLFVFYFYFSNSF